MASDGRSIRVPPKNHFRGRKQQLRPLNRLNGRFRLYSWLPATNEPDGRRAAPAVGGRRTNP
ncbi:hypothetical protein GCM10009020_05860 [Natronoarchaeum mannanilyticum]|uniref:Uncharacterized protein n=1 Tax=Natronoarchaeum mannanilyticum TaxID=926360 RepID=A0AAV3T6Q7_9EURY